MTLTVSCYPFLRDLVFEYSGIVLSDEQEYLVESRLGPLSKEYGLNSGHELIEKAKSAPDEDLNRRMVEAMATGETSWFRDIHPFDTLKDFILPDLIDRRRNRRSLSIWSAAASTGQELFSVAMILDSFFPETNGWELKMLGTDYSAASIERAKRGVFTSLEMNRGLPAMMLAQYFNREGPKFKIDDSIRSKVRFQTLNLVYDWLPPSTYDLILLRNVLLYFNTPTKQKVLASVWSKVETDGYLLLGSTETTLGLADSILPSQHDGATFYQKRSS